MKLSDNAKKLLLLIDRDTEGDEHLKNLRRYCVPGARWENGIGGAGDVQSLKALETRGLIRRMVKDRYFYAVTEEGRLVAQTLKGEGE
jgi:hypothetical protein